MDQGAPPAPNSGPSTHSSTQGTLLMPMPGPTEESQAASPSYILFLILPFLEGAPRPKAPCCSSWARRRLSGRVLLQAPHAAGSASSGLGAAASGSAAWSSALSARARGVPGAGLGCTCQDRCQELSFWVNSQCLPPRSLPGVPLSPLPFCVEAPTPGRW